MNDTPSGLPAPDEIFSFCRRNNGTVDRMLFDTRKTLWDLIADARALLPADGAEVNPAFALICRDYAAKRFGADAGGQVFRSLMTGAMLTADHLGGFYSPQSLQGDFLFGRILRPLGVRCVPVFAFGCVSVSSSTYARGMLAYVSAGGPLRLRRGEGTWEKAPWLTGQQT